MPDVLIAGAGRPRVTRRAFVVAVSGLAVAPGVLAQRPTGGIRTIETVRRYLQAGVSRVVLGTAALTDRAFLEQACQEFPRRILLGLDARDGKVAVKGWTSVSETRAIDLLNEVGGLAIGAVIYTDIARDGMLSGPNLPALKEVTAASSFPVIASGGISRVEDLLAVRALGPRIEGAIVGKALYDGKLDYRSALTALGGL